MSRVISSQTEAAIAEEATRPIHLVRMGWNTEVRAATWDTAITWNSEVWIASGIDASNIDANGGTLRLPAGDDDPWIGLVNSENTRDRTIEVYEYHTDFTASPNEHDATLIFTGQMDAWTLGDSIQITLIESLQNKHFPPTSLGPPTYNYLLPVGTRVQLGYDVLIVS